MKKWIIAALAALLLTCLCCAASAENCPNCTQPSLSSYASNNDGTHQAYCLYCQQTFTMNCIPGAAAACTTPQACTRCDYVIMAALGHDLAYTPMSSATHKGVCQREDCDHETGEEPCVFQDAACGVDKPCADCANTQPNPHIFAETYTSLGDGNHAHYCTVAGCTEHDTPAACSGGEATCVDKSMCEVCDTEYGELAAHSYAAEYTSLGDGTHAHYCSVAGCMEHDEPAACSSGEATCVDKSICEVCDTEYGDLLGHDYSGELYSSDDVYHRLLCINGCGQPGDPEEHWAGEPATCLHGAGCYACGEYYGENAEHDFSGDYAPKGEGKHARVCIYECGASSDDTEDCLGEGEMTCTEGVTCDTCGQEYIQAPGHDFSGVFESLNDGTHALFCLNAGCAEHDTPEACYGGEAACTESAACEACGYAYLTETGHSFGGDYISLGHEDGAHAQYCQNAGCNEHDIPEPCFGGMASCETPAVCDFCGSPYGALAAHDFTGDCVSLGDGTHARSCVACFEPSYNEAEPCSGDAESCLAPAHCALCGWEIAPATGHTIQEIPAVPATCTTSGKTAGEKCAVCNEMLAAPQDIPATGHTIEAIPAVAATCTTGGKTAGEKCAVCDEVITAPQDIPATGHTIEAIPAVAATCTTSGKTAGEKCAVCDEILTAQEDIPATGHTVEAIPAVAATCTAVGKTAGEKCAVCDEVITAPQDIPATGHTVEAIPAIAATCTTSGNTAGEKCAVCDEILTAPQDIPATGHDRRTIPAVPATCTEPGRTAGAYCADCDRTLTQAEDIPATGHTIQAIPAIPADCLNTGMTAGEKCAVCGEILTAPETAPALGHDYQLESTVPPTETAFGYDLLRCTRCEAVSRANYVDMLTPPDEGEQMPAPPPDDEALQSMIAQQNAGQPALEITLDRGKDGADATLRLSTAVEEAPPEEGQEPPEQSASIQLSLEALEGCRAAQVKNVEVARRKVSVVLPVTNLNAAASARNSAACVVEVRETAPSFTPEEAAAYTPIAASCEVALSVMGDDGLQALSEGMEGATVRILWEGGDAADAIGLFMAEGALTEIAATLVYDADGQPLYWELPCMGNGAYAVVIKN